MKSGPEQGPGGGFRPDNGAGMPQSPRGPSMPETSLPGFPAAGSQRRGRMPVSEVGAAPSVDQTNISLPGVRASSRARDNAQNRNEPKANAPESSDESPLRAVSGMGDVPGENNFTEPSTQQAVPLAFGSGNISSTEPPLGSTEQLAGSEPKPPTRPSAKMPHDDTSRNEGADLSGFSREELRRAAEAMPIHEMEPEVTQWLAEEHGIYTTTEPRDPGSFSEFHRKRETARQLERLRDNTRNELQSFPPFEGVEQLGRALADTFGAADVTVTNKDYIPDPKQEKGSGDPDAPVYGKAVADVTYAVSSQPEADRLSYAVQGLFKRPSGAYPLRMYEQDGQHFVEVKRFDEYANRVGGNAIAQLVAEDDLAETNTVLPVDKASLAAWKERGETFHPDVESRLEEHNAKYHESGSQQDKDFRSAHKDPDLLATDAAPVFQVVRDALRPTIHTHRKGSHLNQEQNPNPGERLTIEQDVSLVRDVAGNPEDVRSGPLSPRAKTTIEKQRDAAKAKVRDIMNHKVRAVIKGVATGVGAGVDSLVEVGLVTAATLSGTTLKLHADYRDWEKQKTLAAASRVKTAEKLLELLEE